MAGIQSAIELSDRMSAPLYNICTAVNVVISSLESMQYASGTAFDTSSLTSAREVLAESIVQLGEISNETERVTSKQEQYNQKINESQYKQDQLNQKIQMGSHATDGLIGKVKTLVGAYVGISTVKNVLGLSDELTQTSARLDIMVSKYNELNGTMQTTSELSDMIFQSAQNSRASYLDTAAAVAKLGNNAGDAFASTGEIVEFAELVNKQFTIAGASSTESSNAFLQLTQALGSGVLRGDELNSIFEQAPNLIQTIADYMEIPIGEVREMASEGQITADIVKNAMFAAEDDINEKFAEMPMTWGQLWTSFTNQVMYEFQPLLQRLNDIANSEQMQTCITGILDALSGVATVAVNVIDVMAAGGAFIVDNWSVIAPVIGAVAAVLAIYNGVLLIHNAYEKISGGLKLLSATWAVAHGTATAAEAAATTGATAAQIGFNAALLACPLTWILLIIIAVIAAVYAVVAVINKVKGTTYSATGVICGCINVLLQFLVNLALFIANVCNGIRNAAFALCDDIVAVFYNGIQNTKSQWYSLLSTALWVVEQICAALNKLPFIEFDYSGITSMADDYAAKSAEAAGNKMEYVNPGDAFTEGFNTYDAFADGWLSDAYNSGRDWGQGIDDKVSDFFGGLGDSEDYGDTGSYGTASDMAANVANIAGDTSNISDSLDVSEEDLKYLRDIAEQEAINRFTTAEIKVDMSNMNNTVHNTNDLDGIVDGLTTRVLEAMEVVREGV